MKGARRLGLGCVVLSALMLTVGPAGAAREGIAPFLGTWAFQLHDGYPAWLSVAQSGDAVRVELLWSVGSAKAAENVHFDGEVLRFERNLKYRPYGEAASRVIETPMTARMTPLGLALEVLQRDPDRACSEEALVLLGKPMPPMPPKPDLSKVKFGPAQTLFNGHDLMGWHLSNLKKKNGWHAEDGVLINDSPKTDFGAYGEQGNLCTDRVFTDFELSIEFKVEPGCNSGIYLRGMYEVQVVDRDSRMQGIQGPGALFGRIEPTENAAKPGGEWNKYVLTLVDRHLTVVLNGKTVIDNAPVVGCTGGGMSADDTAPGPIFLQGDHTAVKYRNIVLRPVK